MLCVDGGLSAPDGDKSERKCNTAVYYPKTENGTIVSFHHDGFGVVCGSKELVITDLALEGKRRCAAKEFLNGARCEELKGKVLR